MGTNSVRDRFFPCQCVRANSDVSTLHCCDHKVREAHEKRIKQMQLQSSIKCLLSTSNSCSPILRPLPP